MKIALLIVTLALGAGCRTTSTCEVSSSSVPKVRIGTRARVWEVRNGAETIGLVVKFQEAGRASDSIYVVRNNWQQDLGLIDGLGRAFRYLPHQDEPAWVGSGTVLAGAQHILDVTFQCELVEVSGSESSPVPGPSRIGVPAALESSSERVLGPSNAPPPDGGLPQSR